MHCRALDLSEVVSETAQAFAPAASALGLAVQISDRPAARRSLCDADRDRLGQVVANLVENALKYATSEVVGLDRRIRRPAVGSRGGRRHRDPRTDLARVFERLYQSRSGEGRKLGSGLGLAIVDELRGGHGGRWRSVATGTRRWAPGWWRPCRPEADEARAAADRRA